MNWHIARSLGHSMSVCSGYIEQNCLHKFSSICIFFCTTILVLLIFILFQFVKELSVKNSSILQHFEQQSIWLLEDLCEWISKEAKNRVYGQHTASCHSCIVNKARSAPPLCTSWHLIRQFLHKYATTWNFRLKTRFVKTASHIGRVRLLWHMCTMCTGWRGAAWADF